MTLQQQIPDFDSIHNHMCPHCMDRIKKFGLEEFYICEKPKKTMEEVVNTLENAYKALEKSNSCSLLKRFLNRGALDRLKRLKTNYGSTLLDCIQSGVDNLDSEIGIYAVDIETYTLFGDLFEPIIDCYHLGFKKGFRQPTHGFGDVNSLPHLDPPEEASSGGVGKYVLSVRVKCCRNVDGYPFNPWMSLTKFKETEEILKKSLLGLTGELKGVYKSLEKMSHSEMEKLEKEGVLFKTADRFLSSAGGYRHWPKGRGVYYNEKKTLFAWVNGEDHLSMVSIQKGGDLSKAYTRLSQGMKHLQKEVKFRRDKRLGFLTYCPSHLGTGLRPSAHVRLPKMGATPGKVEDAACKLKLQVRGTRGRGTPAVDSVFEISSKKSLGITEFDQINDMARGIIQLINMEKQL